jgi:outer membrane protein assembly factor BamD (BamD/ComL family)
MGMRVGGSSTAATSQSSSVASWQQRQQSFQDMMSSLQSGDLSAAQQSFKTLAGNNNIQGNSPLAQLGQALQNGDLEGAQQAAQALQSSHSAPSTVITPAQPSSSTSGPGSLINVTG